MVANPFARHLTFFDNQTRARRDHVKYLTLIRTIALLYQHQRPTKTTVHHGKTLHYIEATLDDIAAANALAHEALGRSLDELAPQTRRLLMLIDEMVTAECDRLMMKRADYRFGKGGCCHLFRHTCATLMLEGGADIRFIQQLLSHVSLETTQIYTRVSIRQLKAIHTATHPARLHRSPTDAPTNEVAQTEDAREDLLATLADEAAEEDDEPAVPPP